MKKVLSLLLILSLCLALCACGAGGSQSGAGTAGAETGSASETGTGSASALASMKVGLITLHDENSTYDLNFINGFKEACAELGIPESNYFIRSNVPEGQECYNAAAELVDAGCTYIFADSFGHEDYMIQAAKEFPNVQFCHGTGTKAHTEGLANYHNAFASIYEGRYLAGVAAGLKLQEMIDAGKITADQAKMGYVGAFTYAEVISGYTSFYLGAKSIVPQVTMEVTFTGSWYDETAEKEGATNLINNGCVLISQHADSMGAPTACENAGVPNVSYNGSTAAACPNTFIISSRIDWAPYFEESITATAEGEAIPTDYTGTLATGSVALTDVNAKAAAAGTEEKLAEVMAALMAGSVRVFDVSTFTVDGQGLSSYQADVNTDPDYTPDTEVIKDGYFHESEYRSAPYFDLQIDGITLLDVKF